MVDEADFTVLSNLIAEAQTAILNANSAAEYANGIKMHQYTIAPSNAVNKDRADLILTGTDDAAAINAAFTALVALRASDDVAIRIDFMGGVIDVGEKTDGSAIVIPLGYDNIHLYGNGVKIIGRVYDTSGVNTYSILDSSGNNCILDGFDINNSSSNSGLSNYGTNCTITGNTCSSDYGSGLYNTGTNCIISGNICSGGYDTGLSNTGTNCTITGNICSSDDVPGLSNSGTNCTITGNTCSGGVSGLYNGSTSTTDKCLIIGNICKAGGISVETGTCLPATQEAMADVNTGSITLRT